MSHNEEDTHRAEKERTLPDGIPQFYGDEHIPIDLSRRALLKVLGSGSSVAALSHPFAGDVSGAQSSQNNAEFELTLIEKNEDAGFNFPYYLYAPKNVREKPLIVEPPNQGTGSDEFQDAVETAKNVAKRRELRNISETLQVGLLVPVFPNPTSGEFRNRRIQSLDRETMAIDSGRYERIDSQLINMIDDARDRLGDQGLNIPKEVMLNGFSSTGSFANKFTLLHPERVASVTAGGVNGMGILPLEESQGKTLNYQIGAADIEELTGESFAEDAWKEVPQLCYMGATERPITDDTIPYSDVWKPEQAAKALEVYGEDMQQDRMGYSEAVYRDLGAPTRFEVYDRTGHEYTRDIGDEIDMFHAHHNDIPRISFAGGVPADSSQVDIDVFIPGEDATQFETRVFVNGSEASIKPTTIRANIPNRITVELNEELDVGDTIEVGVFEPGKTTLSEAVMTHEEIVSYSATFESIPEPGDTEIEISWEHSDDGYSGAALYLLPDDGRLEWRRGINLSNTAPGESGNETFSLDTENAGIPFQNGDELELGFVTAGRGFFKGATATETATVSGDNAQGKFAPTSCDTFPTTDGDSVELEFDSPPTVGSNTITLNYDIDSSLEQRVVFLLFSDTGVGRYGRYVDRVDPGTSATEEFELPQAIFEPTDRPVLGETVEVLARIRSDSDDKYYEVLQSDCHVISGVRFGEPPKGGQNDVVVEYMYPEAKQDTGELEISVDGVSAGTVSDITPGTAKRETVSLTNDGTDGTQDLVGDAEITASLRDSSGELVDDTTTTILSKGVADLSFAVTPNANDQHVNLEYSLDDTYNTDRFAVLRLYTAETSSWGAYLDSVSPGQEESSIIEINPDERCVPFEEGEEVEIALVDWNDPYRQAPLATATGLVRGDKKDVQSYADPETGIVQLNGLRAAMNDWESDVIESSILKEVIKSWRNGEVVLD